MLFASSPDSSPSLKRGVAIIKQIHKAGFTFEHEQNANAACENEAIVLCISGTEVR